MKVLLTSTSFQDTPGKHQNLLNDQGFTIDLLRGPVKEEVLLPIIGDYDGIICGDDEITRAVIENGSKGLLRVISKYGVGLDKIDLEAAKRYNIPVTNCIGVNHITVAEHAFALILAFYKNIPAESNITRNGDWKRLIGHEVYGKTIGILGLGKIGKELAIRAKAFGLQVLVYDKVIDKKFVIENDLSAMADLNELIGKVDILSLHLPLNNSTRGIISADRIQNVFSKNTLIVNTARGDLIDLEAVIHGLENKLLAGYVTDVLEEEPIRKNHPLNRFQNVLITPHIGSRTYQSVERQGTMAVKNLLEYINNI